jgi:hypothetical protein
MPTEITLQGSFAAGYTLIDTATGQPMSAVFKELRHALTAAWHCGAAIVYRQNIDFHGRALGSPSVLMRQPRKWRVRS